MAGEEKRPLLDDDDDEDIGYRTQSLGQRARARNKSLVSSEIESTSKFHIPRPSNLLHKTLQQKDHIVAVFVVAFDTKAGNVIEWCTPPGFDLDGVEFKAMPSGSHTLKKDFVYFRKNNFFGLSCFENMPVASDLERGARMKSVGIVATCYTLLYSHMDFLESQVSHQLERPGNYERLQEFWEEKKATLPANGTLDSDSLMTPDVLQNMKITHPAGCFSQFVNFFGEHVFVLWKFALLGKRMIFFSPPPIGVVCYRVYCACSLAHHQLQLQLGCRDIQPHFYINVADIPTLESELSCIACTTEKIFESKTRLYDVYIDNQNIRTSSEHLKDILKVTTADRIRLQKLNTQRSEFTLCKNEYGDYDVDEEEIFSVFFTELNNRLLQTLLDISASADKAITSDTMKATGLDPVGDRTFIMELVELYGIDVMLMVDNPCCPR